MTLDNQVSTMQMRGTSYTGSTERNAHPNTYPADSSNCRRRVAYASGDNPGLRRPRVAADTDQASTFNPLTTHKKNHQRKTFSDISLQYCHARHRLIVTFLLQIGA